SLSEGHFYPLAGVLHRLRFAAHEFDDERPLSEREVTFTVRLNCQPPGLVVPLQPRPGELTAGVVERFPIVFVEAERAIATGVDSNRRRLGCRLSGILPDRIERKNRPGSNVERHRGEIDLASNSSLPGLLLVGPEIVPVAFG